MGLTSGPTLTASTSRTAGCLRRKDILLGQAHVNLQTDLGKLDVLCELGEGEGYDEIVADTVLVDDGSIPLRVLGLPRLIAVKARANRSKDRAVLPVLVATLDEQTRARG